LVEDRGRFLFLVRAKEPGRGLLGLPGGFVDPGEGAEEALAREVWEEVGGVLGPARFLRSRPNVYPFAGVTYHTCDLYFQAPLAGSPADLKADPAEVSELRWLAPAEVRLEDLAFPSLRALWSELYPSSLHGSALSR